MIWNKVSKSWQSLSSFFFLLEKTLASKKSLVYDIGVQLLSFPSSNDTVEESFSKALKVSTENAPWGYWSTRRMFIGPHPRFFEDFTTAARQEALSVSILAANWSFLFIRISSSSFQRQWPSCSFVAVARFFVWRQKILDMSMDLVSRPARDVCISSNRALLIRRSLLLSRKLLALAQRCSEMKV